MKYTVSIPGAQLDVEVPDSFSFDRPVTDDEARDAIARIVSDLVAPALTDQPPYKEIERNASGQISRIVERPGIPATALAEKVGREVARVHLEGASDG